MLQREDEALKEIIVFLESVELYPRRKELD